MLGLERLADSLDAIHAEKHAAWERLMLQDVPDAMVNRTGRITTSTLVMAAPVSLAWAIGTFLMGTAKTVIDIMRVGEGVKQGTIGGIAEDGLRLLNVLPAAGTLSRIGGKGIQMVGRELGLRAMTRVTGNQGIMSCGPTAVSAAARLTGKRFFMTLEEAASVVKTPLRPLDPKFPGMKFHDVETALSRVGVATKPVATQGATLADIESMVIREQKPMIWGVHWLEGTKLRPDFLMRNGEGHMMLAYLDRGGKVMVADQVGVRPIADAMKPHAKYVMDMYEGALFVGDGAVMSGLRSNVVSTLFTGALESNAKRSAMTAVLGVDMVAMTAGTTWSLDAAVRTHLGRPIRTWPEMPRAMAEAIEARYEWTGPRANPQANPTQAAGMAPVPNQTQAIGKVPLPNPLSLTIESDAQLVLAKLPPLGNTTELYSLMGDTGLSEARVCDAVLRLLQINQVIVTSWIGTGSKAKPALIGRAGRIR